MRTENGSSQGQYMALTGVCVSFSLESGCPTHQLQQAVVTTHLVG